MKLAPDLLIAIGLAGWLFWLWRRECRLRDEDAAVYREKCDMFRQQRRW